MSKSTEVRTKSQDLVDDDLSRAMRQDAGEGISHRPEDNIVPQLKILQPLSPEVLEGPDKVSDAKAGDFLLDGKVIKGAEGVWFQPCHVEHKLFEFMPLESGGGFVAEHPMQRDSTGYPRFSEAGDPELPKGAAKIERFKYEFANGNALIHYRQLAGLAWDGDRVSPCIISFKSTGHTTMRLWMTKAARANPFEDGTERPLYSHLYRLTTSHSRNAKGQWYSIVVGDPVCLDPAVDKTIKTIVSHPSRVYVMGRALAQAFVKGEREAALPETKIARDADMPF